MGKKLSEEAKKRRTFRVAERRRKLKELAVEYKGGKCERCGYNKYVTGLDFHHRDPSQKDFGISKSGITRSWEKVKLELDKCILVCKNCHSEIHHEEYQKIREEKLKEYSKKLERPSRQIQTQCGNCKTNMKVPQSRINRTTSDLVFCGRQCKNKFFNHSNWPSNEELVKLSEQFTVNELVTKLRISKSSIYSQLKKAKNEIYGMDLSRRKVKWPLKEELEKLLWQKPTTKIAEQYNVSDKAVEKWTKKYGLTKPPRGYWAKQLC